MEELLKLAVGVSAYDALKCSFFSLYAYVITAFGDIPAISMLMHMKGHNSLSPCQMCTIKGIQMLNLQNKMLYMPLSHCNYPELTDINKYDLKNLLLYEHNSLMVQAKSMQDAHTDKDCKELVKVYGIKGIPLLSTLMSLRFPWSFLYDFMHLIWENLILNLVLFWSGCFKGIDEGQQYIIDLPAWQHVDTDSVEATKTIPLSFGGAIPNPAKD
jgi:hypothetical protein